MERPLSSDEAALWARVLETVRPLRIAPKPVAKGAAAKATPASGSRSSPQPKVALLPGKGDEHSGSAAPRTGPKATMLGGSSAAHLFQNLLDHGVGGARAKRVPVLTHSQPLPGREVVKTSAFLHAKDAGKAGNTLDGSWDKKLARGLISPDCSIDLHGHNLSTAYATLDGALEQSIRIGDRVILLVTGKPPRAESERPHARGAIRAAIGDWLAGSRHGAAIAAVRSAHPRHGGAGALYIILRRSDPNRVY